MRSFATMIKKQKLLLLAIISVLGLLYTAFFVKTFIPVEEKFSSLNLLSEVLKKETSLSNLKKDNEKKIIWFEKENQKTKTAIVYIPGFSATRKEIYPVVESLGKELKANVFLSRFAHHGQGADEYKNIKAQEFFSTVLEAYEIGKEIGEEVVFVGTSTGATMITQLDFWNKKMKGMVLISPAFKIEPWATELLASPLGFIVNRIMVDEYRTWEPKNPDVKKYWDTKYHRDSLPELMKAIYYVQKQDFKNIQTPTLVLYTKEDDVISIPEVLKKFSQIHVPYKKIIEIPSPMHVLAGEISSPQTTQIVIGEIKNWILDMDTAIDHK